jgi:hypothetical protein
LGAGAAVNRLFAAFRANHRDFASTRPTGPIPPAIEINSRHDLQSRNVIDRNVQYAIRS